MASNDAVIVGRGTVGLESALDAFGPGRLAR